MMKKSIAVILLLALTATLFAGCGAKLDYKYDLSEYVTVGNYKNVVIKVPQSEFDAAIKEDLDDLKTETDITDRPAAMGDTISITYEGTLDGEDEPFTGGTGKKDDFVLGKGSFIPGFEEGIVGHNVDEEFDIEVTFPEDYGNNSLNGKKAIFAIKITELKEITYPELTDELVKKEFKVDTVEKYKEDLLKSFVNYSNVWSQVTDDSKVIKYPEKEIKYYKEYYYDSYESYYENVDFETVLSQYLGVTAAQFDEYATSYAEQMVKVEMIMYYIARTENIELTDAEYKEGLKEYAEYYGYTDTKAFESDYGKESLVTALIMDEVADFMLETATSIIVEDEKEDSDEK